MSISPEVDFLDISVTVVSRIQGMLPFDLFIKRAEGAFTRIFKKAEPLDQERLEHYREQGADLPIIVPNGVNEDYATSVQRIAKSFAKLN